MKETVLVPKKGCKRCHGRGVEGLNLTTGKSEMCRCLRRVVIETPDLAPDPVSEPKEAVK